MALVMLALNGTGLGHLIRTVIVSELLASVGERAEIFSEGKYHPSGWEHFPVHQVPSLWASSEEVRRRVAAQLTATAAKSEPAVVVEDTHPNPIHLPTRIRRVLLVRPTSFEYLAGLNERYGSVYSAFLLCDSPGSPTWPYTEDQTRQLKDWDRWHIVGPIYRTPTEEEARSVQERYRLGADSSVCVFSMGGGGVHVKDAKGYDIVRFLRLALEVAQLIQAADLKARLLFVKGPYFPKRIPVPQLFEVVQDDVQMPALLKAARGAVIRAGFNSTWECLAGRTPFLPLIGTTYKEPLEERIGRLTAMGLVPATPEQFWTDAEWRAGYRRIAEDIVTRLPGTPDASYLKHLVLGV